MALIQRLIEFKIVPDTRGLSTVEYVIILALIAALCVGIWKKFGENVEGYLNKSKDEIHKSMQ